MKFKNIEAVKEYMSTTKEYKDKAKDVLFLEDLKGLCIEYFLTRGLLIQINEFEHESYRKGSCLD